MNKTDINIDSVVDEVHQVRAELLSEHDGDIGSLLKKLREVQAASGKKVIERLNPAPTHKQAG